MSELVRIDNHTERMLDRLPAFMRDKPRVEAVIRAFGVQVQIIEQFFWDLFYYAMIDNAEDHALDLLGAVVREARQGWEDAEYRRYIRARIRVNKSDGKIEQLIKIARLLYGLTDDQVSYESGGAAFRYVQAREYYPAALEIELGFNADYLDNEYVNRGFLQKAKAGGVSLHFVVRENSLATSLMFDDSYGGFTATADQRPGYTTDGGKTAMVYGAIS